MTSFNKHLVIQSDFGTADGAVSAMSGVIIGVDDHLTIHHLTHDIPPYDIYLASYRLYQTYFYWPPGTLFLSIVDPGVGYHQKSLAALLKSGHYVLTPDNGTLTHLIKYVGIESVYEIDKEKNLLASANRSHTFYGRDLYAYTAARLSSGHVRLDDLGSKLDATALETFAVTDYTVETDAICGHIAIHDERFGSLWTNIPYEVLERVMAGKKAVEVCIRYDGRPVYTASLPMGQSFQDVNVNDAILYCNSLQNVGIALNQNDFASAFAIGYGLDWTISLK